MAAFSAGRFSGARILIAGDKILFAGAVAGVGVRELRHANVPVAVLLRRRWAHSF